MPYQVDDALLHAMSGTELSRVRTELRLLPEPNNQRLLMSRGADIVMQSCEIHGPAPCCDSRGVDFSLCHILARPALRSRLAFRFASPSCAVLRGMNRGKLTK